MKVIRHHWVALVALLVLNLIIFARLVFLSPAGVPYATIPFDFASQYSVWLVYIGDCIKSGYFPLWSPYVGAGTPFFINPQSQLYSPLTLLVAATVGYTQRVAQLQSIFMLFFGGVGAYALSYALWRNRWAAFITALCFNFSSAVFGNLQHMTIINSTTLAPWLFLSTMLTVREGKAWGYPAAAFFVYFLITSGYPGVILMSLIWLFIYTAYLILKRADTARVKLRLGIYQSAAWLLGLCMAAAHWLPIVLHRKEFTRGEPLTLEQALLGGNLFFKHVWGLFFQFMMENSLPGGDADISMRGLYIGALALPLALAALLLLSKNEIVPALFVFSASAFLMACGGLFFGRVFLHILFPVLNMSRFPAADSRSLMALGLALLAGGGATLLLREDTIDGRRLVSRACVALLGVLVLGLFGFRSVYSNDVYNNVVLNFVTVEALFVAVAILALRLFAGRRLMACLVVLLALELGTCVLANMKYVGAPVESHAEYLARRARQRRVFTSEAAGTARIAGGENLVSEESGQAYLSKTFYLSEYNPLRLRRFDRLLAGGFSEWMTTGARVVALPPDAAPANYESFQQQARPVGYSILAYTPNRIVYKVRLEEDSTLVFNEVNFPGWRATIDGRRTPVGEVGGGLRAVKAAAGEHMIVLTFKPSSFRWGIAVSLLSAALLVVWMALIYLKGRRALRASR